MRRAHLRDTESRKINIKKTVVGKGWHGDRLGHSLASRGLKPAEHKHLYQGTLSDKVFDFLRRKDVVGAKNRYQSDNHTPEDIDWVMHVSKYPCHAYP